MWCDHYYLMQYFHIRLSVLQHNYTKRIWTFCQILCRDTLSLHVALHVHPIYQPIQCNLVWLYNNKQHLAERDRPTRCNTEVVASTKTDIKNLFLFIESWHGVRSGIYSRLKDDRNSWSITVSPPAPTQVFIPPSNLPPPKALIFDDNLATAWKSWKTAWQRYEIATGVHKQEGIVCVSTLPSIIDEDGIKAHNTFTWNEDENADNISQVLKKFDEFFPPRTQVIYERFRFNNRNQ